MSFRPLIARAGAAATAGAAVFNQNAHARSAPLPSVAQHVAEVPKGMLDDEWTMAQFDLGEVVFRPEDITEAAADFRAATSGIQLFEEHDDTSSNDSDERRATEIIELSESMQAAPVSTDTYVNQQGVDMLLDLATEMLRRPKVQQEVMSVIADNPRLRKFLIQGPPTSPLITTQRILQLEAPPARSADATQAGAEETANEGEDIWGDLLSHLQHTLCKVGSGLDGLRHRLGHFLRALLLGPDQKAAASAAAAAGAQGADKAEGGDGGVHNLLRAAMAVAVVLACLAVTRRPGLVAALAALAAKRAARA